MASKQKSEEKILNYTLNNLNIKDICPNSVDGVVLSIEEENMVRIDLPSAMTAESFKKWLRGKGGVFSKDVRNFIKGKPAGTYILMEGEGERTILRLIEDDEFPAFEIKKLVDGKVKDKAYMILRTLKENEPLISSILLASVSKSSNPPGVNCALILLGLLRTLLIISNFLLSLAF